MTRRSFNALNSVLLGDCVGLMRGLAAESVDFVLTDPPYIVRYRGRDGRTVRNDDNDRWLAPAFAEIFRASKADTFCVSFYGWNKIDLFMSAWRAAGFRIAGHIVFRKHYASSVRYMRYEHEQAYLLSKGDPSPSARPISDVIDWTYTGNRLHPTQKPIEALEPLIAAFCEPHGLVLIPFAVPGPRLSRQGASAGTSSASSLTQVIS